MYIHSKCGYMTTILGEAFSYCIFLDEHWTCPHYVKYRKNITRNEQPARVMYLLPDPASVTEHYSILVDIYSAQLSIFYSNDLARPCKRREKRENSISKVLKLVNFFFFFTRMKTPLKLEKE